MSDNIDSETVVPVIGSGELVDLDDMKKALLNMTDQDLTDWYVKYFNPLRGAVAMIKTELISRMVKNGAEVLHAPNGQRVELRSPPKRICDKEVLTKVEEKIALHYSQVIRLMRIKETVEPDMSGIKKARKLGMDITMAIAEGLREEPGYPSIKIEGVDKDRAKVFEPKD